MTNIESILTDKTIAQCASDFVAFYASWQCEKALDIIMLHMRKANGRQWEYFHESVNLFLDNHIDAIYK